MSLLTKLIKKYNTPEVEIEYINEDIITSSIQMAKLSPEELVEETKKKEQTKKLTFSEKYPDGLPREVLEQISYTKFGAMLKQERLLPPSYDKAPVKIEIDEIDKKPRVVLTFKSITSESRRIVSIYGYTVAYFKKINQPITILEINHSMCEVWRNFAEYVMDYWDSTFRFVVMKKDL